MIAFTYKIEEESNGRVAIEFALDEKERTSKETVTANAIVPVLDQLILEVLLISGSGAVLTKDRLSEAARVIVQRHLRGK